MSSTAIKAQAFFRKVSANSEPSTAEDDITPTYTGEFWTAKQRQAHSLHEISYRACFKPQLPKFFIDGLCEPNDTIYDPFMGRGTKLIEAHLHGHPVIGNDANPLSRILAEPRLHPVSIGELELRLQKIKRRARPTDHPELLIFFDQETLAEIEGLRDYFQHRRKAGLYDQADGWIQMIACNRLTGHSKGFFSVYTLPPNQATSLERQKKINLKRDQVPEYRDTNALIVKKAKSLLRDCLPLDYGRPASPLLTGSADHTPEIADSSVQLIVTSPPFLDIVDYRADNWMRMWFCEIDIDTDHIWQLRSVDQWIERMTTVFNELSRVLKPSGWIAFEVGEVRKGTVKLETAVITAASQAGLVPECVIVNQQNFTKTANCWGISNNASGTNSNRIVLLRKA